MIITTKSCEHAHALVSLIRSHVNELQEQQTQAHCEFVEKTNKMVDDELALSKVEKGRKVAHHTNIAIASVLSALTRGPWEIFINQYQKVMKQLHEYLKAQCDQQQPEFLAGLDDGTTVIRECHTSKLRSYPDPLAKKSFMQLFLDIAATLSMHIQRNTKRGASHAVQQAQAQGSDARELRSSVSDLVAMFNEQQSTPSRQATAAREERKNTSKATTDLIIETIRRTLELVTSILQSKATFSAPTSNAQPVNRRGRCAHPQCVVTALCKFQ